MSTEFQKYWESETTGWDEGGCRNGWLFPAAGVRR